MVLWYSFSVKRILRKIKDFLIPHEGNEFKPHFFREYMLGIVSIIVIFLAGASFSGSLYIRNSGLTAAVLPAVLVDLTNNDRVSIGEPELNVSQELEYAAKLKAEDMSENQYFAHVSPTGVTPWYWMKKANYSFIYAGENLAIDFTESSDVSRAWMNSPKHKQNILDKRFTDIGIAAKEGILNGKPTVFVVQMFGKPVFVESNNIQINELDKSEIKIESLLASNNKEEGVVKGEVIETPKVEIIENGNDLIVAKNLEVEDSSSIILNESNTTAKTNSPSLIQKEVYKTSLYVYYIYKFMLYAAILAMFIFVGVEYKKQHPKNIIYGIIVISLIFILFYINQAYFALPGIF